MPTISVIVPVFNVEKYIKRCCASILSQSYVDFEILLIDDGSDDESSQICDAFAVLDHRIKVIHTKNKGASSARNIGIKISCGMYISFCDSDDHIENDFLHTMLEGMSNNSDLVVSGFYEVDENELVTHTVFEEQRYIVINNWDERVQLLIDILCGKPTWCVWRRFFKANLIKQHRIFFCESSESYAEDLTFVLSYILYCNSIVYLDYVGYKYVDRNNSLIHKNKNRYRLNSLNENSIFFRSYLLDCISNNKNNNVLPLFHFLMMNTEYERIKCAGKLCDLSIELSKIQDKKRFKKWTLSFFFQRKYLQSLFSNEQIHRMKCLSFYCLHGNYRLFCMLDSFYYKFIHKYR